MGKVETLKAYITSCTDVLDSKNNSEAEKLQDKIIGVYYSEIPSITGQLDNYQPSFGSSRAVNWIGDIEILKAKLINYMDNLEQEDKNRADELEKLRLQQSIFSINNNNHNQATAKASSETSVVITIEQTTEMIQKLPDDVLSQEDKDELEEKLAAVEVARNGKDKEKLASKVGNVLKYITDKGVEVGIAVLPYLGEIAKIIH
jgi:hypothetical protein